MSAPDNTSNNSSGPSEKKNADNPVKEGKKAIEASKIADPKPEEQQREQDKQDAENWRNEG
ncbi:MAG: hypothetical protein H7Y03_07825 [Chitinophagaceae bacterium]|nr:hypothetical protein [Chitinophagaceae bacterium]